MLMTGARARTMRGCVAEQLSSYRSEVVSDLYIELGHSYLMAMPSDLSTYFTNASVVYGSGKIGERMRALRLWLGQEDIGA